MVREKECVGGVAEALAHLPSPGAPGREHGGAAMAVGLRNKQRQLAAASTQAGQYRGSGLGSTGVLVIGKIGKLLPALSVLFGIVEEARNGRIHSGPCQLDGRGIAMEVVAPRGQKCGQELGEVWGRR